VWLICKIGDLDEVKDGKANRKGQRDFKLRAEGEDKQINR